MGYAVEDPHDIQKQPVKKSHSSKTIICIVICFVLIIAIVIVGVGLGVGLGIGLQKKTNDNTDSSSENIHISAPIVNCTYNESTCGCAANKPIFLSSRIVNGYNAVAHSWPWTVLLYDNNVFICQGFLFTYEYVLTAAHCIVDKRRTSLKIHAGVHLRSSSTNRQIRNIIKMTSHPEYTPEFLNDIAILKLDIPMVPTTAVRICCLPSNPRLPIENEVAVIVGWGKLHEGTTSNLPDVLQQTIVEIQACRPSSNFTGQFCAGYNKNDACQGDSGGPLMTNVNNLWTCTGIVSYGFGCGNGGYYTRVSSYRSFIDKAILSM